MNSAFKSIIAAHCDDCSAPESVFRYGMAAKFAGAVSGRTMSASSATTSFETQASEFKNEM